MNRITNFRARDTRQKVEPDARLSDGITMALLRLSVGLEDCDDLLADLDQALAAV